MCVWGGGGGVADFAMGYRQFAHRLESVVGFPKRRDCPGCCYIFHKKKKNKKVAAVSISNCRKLHC